MVGRKFVMIAAAMAASGAPAVVAAQALSPEVEALDAQLPGTLVSDPSRIDWESFGPDFYAESIKDPAIPGGGAARRFHINKATEFIYTAGANIPLIRNVKRGDPITIGFWARTVSAATDDGKGVLRVRFQQDAPPYPGFGEQTLAIGGAWEWYEVSATAEQSLNRTDGIVSIQFGRTKQILEIGQAIVVTGATAIAAPAQAAAPIAVATSSIELPKPLQNVGRLINDPTRRDWRTSATAGATEQRDEPRIWLGKATRLTTNSGGPDSTVKVALELPGQATKGEEVLIAFAARTVGSANADGRAVLDVSLETAAKGEPLSGTRIALGPNWQLVRYIARPAVDAQAGELMVGIQLAGPGHSVDIGPVYMFRPQ